MTALDSQGEFKWLSLSSHCQLGAQSVWIRRCLSDDLILILLGLIRHDVMKPDAINVH